MTERQFSGPRAENQAAGVSQMDLFDEIGLPIPAPVNQHQILRPWSDSQTAHPNMRQEKIKPRNRVTIPGFVPRINRRDTAVFGTAAQLNAVLYPATTRSENPTPLEGLASLTNQIGNFYLLLIWKAYISNSLLLVILTSLYFTSPGLLVIFNFHYFCSNNELLPLWWGWSFAPLVRF